jgi:hypothetical protein
MSAWNVHGPESFAFKVLEEIDLEQLTYGRERAQGADRALARGFGRRGCDLTFPRAPRAWHALPKGRGKRRVDRICIEMTSIWE